MTILYTARHGETDYNFFKRYQGRLLGIHLNDQGHRDAEHLREVFQHESLDAVLSSMALRARQCATPIAEEKGLSLIILPDLIERDHGDLTDTSYRDVDDVYAFLFGNEDRENGEPWEHVHERAQRVFSERN